mmetsp:Transcript_7954/g.15068  ORF Transcript_7954/g.15068 Transcript_7954/m.15068 type:complete len:115 (+) Transcript_7954:296-640(+)
MVKSLDKGGFCKQTLVQMTYAIGADKSPFFVETDGSDRAHPLANCFLMRCSCCHLMVSNGTVIGVVMCTGLPRHHTLCRTTLSNSNAHTMVVQGTAMEGESPRKRCSDASNGGV